VFGYLVPSYPEARLPFVSVGTSCGLHSVIVHVQRVTAPTQKVDSQMELFARVTGGTGRVTAVGQCAPWRPTRA
jgi:hypothetical protein